MSRLQSALRSPLFHFVVLGAVLFAAEAALESGDRDAAAPAPARAPIVVSAEQLHVLESGFRATYGSGPTPEQRRALIEQAIQDEMLYREARVLALGLEDGSVRRRLVEKMRALNDRPGANEEALVRDAVALGLDDDLVIRRLLATKMRLVLQQREQESAPSDAEIHAYVDRHREELLQPSTLSLSHVFFSEDVRGSTASSDAAAVLASLRAGTLTAERAADLSDPFPLGSQLRGYSQPQLQGRFGKPFAEQVFALASGEWSEPVRSPFGLHLVRIDERKPSSLPPLEDLRRIALRALHAERADQRFAQGLARLRSLYEIQIEGDAAARGDVPTG